MDEAYAETMARAGWRAMELQVCGVAVMGSLFEPAASRVQSTK